MASSTDFDLNHLLAPIAGGNPAGVDLRSDAARGAAFRTVKDAREEARRIERQADMLGEESTQAMPHWRAVRDQGLDLLANDSKDLEVAAYVIEALVRTDGFAGLRQGLHVARELVENFWDVLYPLPDEDGMATRVLPLARLNGDGAEGLLIAPIYRIPITQGSTVGPYACWHHRQANDLAGYSDREREERIKRGAVTPEQFHQALNETDLEFFRQLIQDLVECRVEYEHLIELLDEKCGRDGSGYSVAPPSSAIREALENCLITVRSVTKDRLPQETETQASSSANSPGGNSAGHFALSAGGGNLQTREDAFRVLLTVADFFERAEPLSLLPAQIRRVVRLGRMTPAEYYSELIEDRTVRDQLFKMVGIKAPAEESS